jgi:lysophospholipase L1-like esterase
MSSKTLKKLLVFFVFLNIIFISLLVDFFRIGSNSHLRYLGLIQTLIILVALVLVLEFIFQLIYIIKRKNLYTKESFTNFRNMYVIPHPYFPWAYKPNSITSKVDVLNYPLHKGKFKSAVHKTNFLGFADGQDGTRQIELSKRIGQVRIACLGASTTGNYISERGEIFSYPSELEKYLTTRENDFQVINCASGGHNSAELLIRFVLQVIDLKPDYIIIYHGYNDIRSYLTPGIKSDYSHSRRSIGEVYWKYYLANAIPTFGLSILNFLIRKHLVSNVRNSLLDQVSKGAVDLSANPAIGLELYRRNLQTVIFLAKSYNIEVILSTFCHYLHKEIQKDETHVKYHEIVGQENEIIRELAKINEVRLVDNAVNFQYRDDLFVDSIHFTPKGMKRLAKSFLEIIEK